MLHGKKIIAIVPARGGSKGIKLKNLISINGVPIVALVGDVIKELDYIDRAVVSTDHPKIAEVAKQAGLDAPFYRPDHLSGDFIGDVDVLVHALLATEDIDNRTYDVVVMLQPTSPLRKPEHVTETIEKLIKGNYDAVWTVSETDLKYHPLKQLFFDDKNLDYYDSEGSKIIARQQLQKVYHRNGAAYAITRNCLVNDKSIKGGKTSAVVLKEPMISIDDRNDAEIAELLFRKNK